MKKKDSNVLSVLKDDGLEVDELKSFFNYQNKTTTNIQDLQKELGDGSWAVRVAYNDRFGGVLIRQQTGEGNRKHKHPFADENWIILEGEWEWWIEGQGTKKVCKGDIVVVPKETWHLITCIKGPGLRYAITQPDVEHVYYE